MGKWKSSKKQRMIAEAQNLLSQYGKMTVRQIYYKLVVKGLLRNTRSQYNTYDVNLRDARRDGTIDPRDILDTTHQIHNKLNFYSSPKDFLKCLELTVQSSSDRYHMDLWKNQNKYLAIFLEKDALARIFVEVAEPYQVPIVVARGNASDSQLVDFIDYMRNTSGVQNPYTLIQVYSDLDPEGDVIAGDIIAKDETQPQLDRRLHAYGFYNFKTEREAILPHQIKPYNLQKNIPDLAKTLKDTNAPQFYKLHGNHDFYELDAFDTNDLKRIIRTNIEKHIAFPIWTRDLALETKNRQKIDKILKNVKI